MTKHKITEISWVDSFYGDSGVLVGLEGKSELTPQSSIDSMGEGYWLHGWFTPDLPPIIDGEVVEKIYFFGVKAEEVNG